MAGAALLQVRAGCCWGCRGCCCMAVSPLGDESLPAAACFSSPVALTRLPLLSRTPPQEGVDRLVEDANRLEPFFLNLAAGNE